MVPGGGHPSDPAPMGFNLALVVGAEQSGAAGAEALAVATTPALKAPTQFNEKYLQGSVLFLTKKCEKSANECQKNATFIEE